jgi:uncharacterized protein involved in propanediol utilization
MYLSNLMSTRGRLTVRSEMPNARTSDASSARLDSTLTVAAPIL